MRRAAALSLLPAVALAFAYGSREPARAQAAAASPPGLRPGAVARLDEHMSRLATFGYSGAVLVARGDDVLLRKGYGSADDLRRRPVTADTVFDVCSLTKQFTAAAILQLETEGRLRTEDLLSSHLQGVPSDKATITLHHLLIHGAGIDDPPIGDRERWSRDDYVRAVLDTKLLWPPGSRYAYSNGGYSLLGAIVETVSGQSYEDFLDQHLFTPSGLKATGYRRGKWDPESVAHGHADDLVFGSPLDHPGLYIGEGGKRWPGPYWALAANGGILSTVDEMYRWVKALQHGPILSDAARQKLFSPHILAAEWGNETRYAYGWNVTRLPRGATLIHHTGSDSSTGFNAWTLRYAADDVTVVLLSNRVLDGTRLTRAIFQAVDAVLYGPEPPLPPIAAPGVGDLSSYAGLYRLPTDETLVVEATAGGLAIAGRGDAAVVALAFGGQPAALRAGLQGRIDTLLRGLASGRIESLRPTFWAERKPDEEAKRLHEWWTSLSSRYGTLRAAKVLGTGSHEFLRQVYVALDLSRGRTRVLFEENPSGALALNGDRDAARIPDRFLFLPQADGSFASFNLRLGSGSVVRFEKTGAGAASALSIETAEGPVVARWER